MPKMVTLRAVRYHVGSGSGDKFCALRILCTLRIYHLGSVPVISESLMKYMFIARLHLFSVPRRPPGCRGWRWRREAWGDHLAQHSGLMLQQPTLHKHNYETHRACMGPVAALYLWLSLVKSYAGIACSTVYIHILYIGIGYISIQ